MMVRSVLLMMLLLGGASVALAAGPREQDRVVSIRVHDYVTIDARQLQQAEQQVSETYARAGVHLAWRDVARPNVDDGARRADTADLSDITIVVMTQAMSGRLNLASDVAGYAPITREHGGRVAFVLGDRTLRIAAEGGVEPSKVLAGVITHELAHLLMPQRLHTRDGLMRAYWTPSSFRHADRQDFTKSERESLRRTVRALGGERVRVAD